MSDTVREWLIQMFTNELEEAEVSQDNEEIWALGSPTVEEAEMHTENAAELANYKEVLAQLKKHLEEGGELLDV